MIKTREPISGPILDVIAEIDRLEARNAVLRIAALESLGTRWVLHPAYQNPGHHCAGHRASAVLADVMTDARRAGRI